MTRHSTTPNGDALAVELNQLAKGIDPILERWTGENQPTKLSLLNDLAAAIRPGAN